MANRQSGVSGNLVVMGRAQVSSGGLERRGSRWVAVPGQTSCSKEGDRALTQPFEWQEICRAFAALPCLIWPEERLPFPARVAGRRSRLCPALASLVRSPAAARLVWAAVEPGPRLHHRQHRALAGLHVWRWTSPSCAAVRGGLA